MLFDELFLEGPDYQNMFNVPVLNTGSVNIFWMNSFSYVQSVIQKAKIALQKNDRIVWFLRLFRLQELQKLKLAADSLKSDEPFLSNLDLLKKTPTFQSDKEKNDKIITDIDRLLQQYLFRYKKSAGYAPDPNYILGNRTPIESILPKLEHFLSLPIPEIQDTIFSYQNPVELIKAFSGYEKKWQESRQGMISANETQDATVVLPFSNGFAWYNLNKAYCSKEADAMGHCGNEPRADSGDTILSLRKAVKKGKQTFYMPYCTFILLEDDTLGEMKGRFNKSPKNAFKKGFAPSDFTDEIYALLKLPMIKGITGGGYMPQENFKISDLRPEQVEELEKAKPSLMPLMYRYKKYGITPDLIKGIRNRLVDLDIFREIKYDENNKGFIWDYETTMANFIENNVTAEGRSSKQTALWAMETLEEGGDNFSYDLGVDTSDKDGVLDDLKRKHPEMYANLERYVTTLWIKDNPKDEDEDDYDDMDLVDMIVELDGDIDMALDTAVRDGHQRGAEKEMYEYFHKWLDNLKDSSNDFWITLPEWDEKYYNGKVVVLVSPEHLIEMLDEGTVEDDDSKWEVEDMDKPYNGFSGYDDEAALDYFTNEMHHVLTGQETADQGV